MVRLRLPLPYAVYYIGIKIQAPVAKMSNKEPLEI